MATFAPLALTQVLPFLPLAQGDIDYQSERRGDPDLIDTLLANPSTTVILVRQGRLAVPHGQGALSGHDTASMRLATLPGAYVAKELRTHPEAVAMFLGGYGGAQDEHVIAVDISRIRVPGSGNWVPDAVFNGADSAFDEADAGSAGQTAHQPSMFEQALNRFDWVDLRGFAPHASAREAGQATTAASLGLWHVTQRHCPTCGAPVNVAMAGWAQQCTNPDDGQRMLFPRVEPAVITAIVDADDRLLLQHNNAWNDPRLYSVSAGFVEAGENLEHACRREAKEEVGVTLGEVRYLGSQPWPFPASLMVAFKAYALDTDIHVDGNETMTAQWVTRDEYTRALATGRIVAPGRAAIARYMIEEWYGQRL